MTRRAGLILSSYAAAPALDGRDPVAEAAFLSGAAALPHVTGLEIPFYATGRLHKYDGDWLVQQIGHLPADFSYVLTTIPDTMDRLGASVGFGLASADLEGKRAALERTAAAAEAVRTLNRTVGRKAVRAVHLYSAPRLSVGEIGTFTRTTASVEALADSLKQLAEYDWDGARPVLEHCDAASGHYPPVKGFLQLDQEIEAVLAAGTGAGVTVNWARSVIEGRDTNAPDRHVELALQAGVLAGVVLSGCSSQATAYGGAWDDTHLPPAPVEPASLLTSGAIRSMAAVLEGAPTGPEPEVYRGLKVSAPRGASVEQRLSLLAASIDAACRAGF
ncbi:DUF4862 family protein [Arthrobacter sp. HMWF013]|uniref:DUF4862 family protein n=1 Tax=Arthrobacter sp. HMWF013 TaxID=2056849 RepID=UPI000D3819EA|nr:DUF4862 family protein [Arthrobacter sp. HMWF013]PTT70022.1 DUF4862 domain-containing protein [Arthrobacter sp. HMWF013]